MNNFDNEIDDFINDMDKLKISKKNQIEYLKTYSKMLNHQREKIDNNFIIGTFISGVGVGNLFTSPYLSTGVIALGITIGIVGYAKNYPDIKFDDVKIKSKKKP